MFRSTCSTQHSSLQPLPQPRLLFSRRALRRHCVLAHAVCRWGSQARNGGRRTVVSHSTCRLIGGHFSRRARGLRWRGSDRIRQRLRRGQPSPRRRHDQRLVLVPPNPKLAWAHNLDGLREDRDARPPPEPRILHTRPVNEHRAKTER